MKQNITAPVLVAPTVVGHIDLNKHKKAEKKSEKTFLPWKNFPIADYEAMLAIRNAANLKIGKDSVTVSKIAKVDNVINPAFGSIWYSCGSKDFRENFKKPFELHRIGNLHGIRRISHKEIADMAPGHSFSMVYLMDDLSKNEVVKCKKAANDSGVWYISLADKKEIPFSIEDITVDGKFYTGVEGETGYLFVDKTAENL